MINEPAGTRNVTTGRDARGSVVAGDHNLVIGEVSGSSVTVLMEGQRPAPVRRETIRVLPRPPHEPLGREAETAELAAAIAAGGTVELCGPPGTGRSTLLRHLAHTVHSGPDGVVFVSATHGRVADLAQEIFEACYETRGYAPSRGHLRTLLAGLRLTVYVDDADLTVEQARELTDVLPAATFVLTSRDSALLGDGPVHHLGGLGQLAATRLLTRTLDRPLLDGERATIADLWQAAHGNPLLLKRVAGLARSPRSPLPPPGAVVDLLPRLLRQLDEVTTSALNVLATLEGADLAVAHIGALLGVADPLAVCARLADLGLAVSTEHGFRCAPGVAPALRERQVAPFPTPRLCQYFTLWAADPATRSEWIAAHDQVFVKVIALATEAGQPELAVDLGRAVSPKLAHSLRFDAWGQVLGHGWQAARRAGDRPAEAYFTHEEGVRALVTGRRVLAAVLLTQAVVLWTALGEHHGATSATQAQGLLPPRSAPPETVDPPQAVTDHMTQLRADPTPTTEFPDLSFSGSPPNGFTESHFGAYPDPSGGIPHSPGPGPSAVDPGGFTAAPVGADPVTAATGWAPSAIATTAGAAASGGSILSTIVLSILAVVVSAAIVNVVADAISTESGDTEETGIAGTWEDDEGNLMTITESAPGEYTTPAPCGNGDVELHGDDTGATGEGPLIESSDGTCGPVIGTVDVTITVSQDGRSAQLTSTMPPGQSGPDGERLSCFTCGTTQLTRAGT